MSDDKSIATRKKLLDAAEDVFSEFGFHKALVEEIANRAGLGKGTIYRYFENKEELFKSLMEEHVNELTESVMNNTSGKTDPIEKIKITLKAYLDFFKMHKRLFSILVFEDEGAGCKNAEECWEKRTGYAKILEAFISDGISKNVFKKLEPMTLSYCMLGMLNYLIIKWMRSEVEYDLTDELDTVYEMTFNGILN